MKAEMVRLGDFIKIKHGFAFKSEHFAESGDNILLTPGNFGARGGLVRKVDKDRSYDGPIPAEFVLARGDVLVAMTDLTQDAPILGATLTIPEDGRYLHNQRLGKVIVTAPRRITLRYAAHVLNLEHARAQIRGSATGATVRHTAPDRIGDVKVPLLPFDDQIRATTLLDAIDDLIDNNLRRIRVLEEVVARIWDRLTSATQPGIARVPLAEVIEIDPRVALAKDSNVPFVSMNALSTTSMVIERPSDRRAPGGSRFQNGDTLLARITPCVENGKTGFVQFLGESDPSACGSTEFIVLRSKGLLPPEFVYSLARSHAFRDVAIKSMGGSDGRQRVKRDAIAGYEVWVPTGKALLEYTVQARPAFQLVEALASRNANLVKLRDLLLPKLLSSEVDVSRLPLPPEEPE